LTLDLLPKRVDVGGLEHLAGDLALVDLLEHWVGGGVLAPEDGQPRTHAPEASADPDPQHVQRQVGRVLGAQLDDGVGVALDVDRDRLHAAGLIGHHALCPAPEAQ
jgi:hypothetical protein